MKAIIFEDELLAIERLHMLLSQLDQPVEVIASFESVEDGISWLDKNNLPDLIISDIHLADGSAFDIFAHAKIPTPVIFVTAHDQYALDAFKFFSIDYLLKPVDEEELKSAVQKVIRRSQKPIAEQLEILMQKINQPSTPVRKIAMPTMEGFQMIMIDSIISCEADSNYTTLHLKGNKKIVVCRNLKDIEEMLEDHSFTRVHRCHVVNLNEVEKFVKGEGGYLIMSDGTTIDVARTKKEILLKRLLPHKE